MKNILLLSALLISFSVMAIPVHDFSPEGPCVEWDDDPDSSNLPEGTIVGPCPDSLSVSNDVKYQEIAIKGQDPIKGGGVKYAPLNVEVLSSSHVLLMIRSYDAIRKGSLSTLSANKTVEEKLFLKIIFNTKRNNFIRYMIHGDLKQLANSKLTKNEVVICARLTPWGLMFHFINPFGLFDHSGPGRGDFV